MLSLILFRFTGCIAAVKLKNRVVRFFLIFVCTLLISGCDSKPPRPMPYQTTPDVIIGVRVKLTRAVRLIACELLAATVRRLELFSEPYPITY